MQIQLSETDLNLVSESIEIRGIVHLLFCCYILKINIQIVLLLHDID
jgi:hypothetical protein